MGDTDTRPRGAWITPYKYPEPVWVPELGSPPPDPETCVRCGEPAPLDYNEPDSACPTGSFSLPWDRAVGGPICDTCARKHYPEAFKQAKV